MTREEHVERLRRKADEIGRGCVPGHLDAEAADLLEADGVQMDRLVAERSVLLRVAAEGAYQAWDKTDNTATFGDAQRIWETMVDRVRVELEIARQASREGLPGLMLEVMREVLAEVLAEREREAPHAAN